MKKTVFINTTQNVEIEYELASVGSRVASLLFDYFFLFLFLSISSALFADFYESETFSYIFFTILAFIGAFYTLISEFVGKGQTLGKKILGLKVIKLDGKEMEFSDYFNRWSVRLIDVHLTSGLFAFFLANTHVKSQRLGDIIAGTVVIRKVKSDIFSLNDIVKLNNNQKLDYQFAYPQVKMLNDKDVITIKKTIYYFQKHNNETHKLALENLILKLKEILNIEQLKEKPIDFLNLLIKEYILLTR